MLIYNSIGQARNTETERPCHSECVTGLQSRVSGGSINLWTKLPNPEVSKWGKANGSRFRNWTQIVGMCSVISVLTKTVSFGPQTMVLR